MRYFATRLPAALITFVLGIAAANFAAYLRSSEAPLGSEESAVLAVEREYVRAHVERDVVALERVLADDFTSFGGRVTKERRLALLANPLFTVSSLETEGVSVSVSGDDAWVNGHAVLTAGFRGRQYTTPRYSFTRHYVKREGRWQILSCEFSFFG